jgi:hypothetical protein
VTAPGGHRWRRFGGIRALTFSTNRPHRTITYEHAQNELAEHHYQRE